MRQGTLVLLLGCAANVQAQARTLNLADARIRYEVSGQGRALVFIHGWAQSLEIWDEQVRAFASNHRVVRFDRRGFGASTGHADDTADASDLSFLLDSLGIRSARIVGLSAGATTALSFALAYPSRVQALVLYGMPPLKDFPGMGAIPTPREVFREIARQHGLDSVRAAVLASPLAWVPPGRDDLTRAYRQGLAAYNGKDLLEPHGESGRVPHPLWAQVPAIRVPTLVINGDHDLPMILAFGDSLARRIPGASRVIIKDGGHGAHFAQPEQFNGALQHFFTGLRP